MAISEFSDVFISYRRKDVDFVKPLVDALHAAGKEVWIDWEDIPPGSVGFTDDIRKGVEGADAFIAVLSPDYLESPYCVDMELGYAIQLNKKLIPVVYRKFEDHPIPLGIGHINWIYFTPHAGQPNIFDESFPKVMEALETDLDHVRNHKRLLLRALEWQDKGRSNSFLLKGDEIKGAESWLANGHGKDPLPTDLHKTHIAISRQRATQQQRMLLAGTGIALVISIFLTILSLVGFNQASINANIAATNESNAIDARATSVARAEEADARLLGSKLATIGRTKPFLAYGLGLSLLDVKNRPLIVNANVRELLFNQGAIRQIEGHSEMIFSIAYSPDSQLITTGSSVNLFTAGDDAALQAALDEGLCVLAAVPGSQPSCILGEIIVWDATSGEILHKLQGHGGNVTALEFSGDGQFVASAASDSVILWDVESGEVVQKLSGSLAEILDIQFVSEDRELIALANDGNYSRWNVDDGAVIDQQNISNFNYLNAGTFTHDGKKIVMNNLDSTSLWNIEAGEADFELAIPGVTKFAISPDDSHFVAVQNSILSIWSINGDSIVSAIELSDPVAAIEYSPNGTRFATSGSRVQIWNAETGQLIRSYPQAIEGIKPIAYAPDGNSISTSFMPNNALILDTIVAEARKIIYQTMGHPVFLSGGEQVVYFTSLFADDGSINSDVVLWNITNESLEYTIPIKDNNVTDIAVDKDLNRIYIATQFGGMQIANLQDGEITHSLPLAEAGPIYGMIFSPDKKLLALSADPQQIYLPGVVLLETDSLTTRFPEKFVPDVFGEGGFNSITFNPDGKTALMGAFRADGVQEIDLETGDVIRTIATETPTTLAYLPDGKSFLISPLDEQSAVIVYDAQTGRALTKITGIAGRTVASPDSTRLMSVEGTNLYVWDIKTGEQLRNYVGHSGDILDFGFMGDALSSWSSTANEVIIWKLDYSDDDLRQWAAEHLQVAEITCEDRELYRTPILCQAS